MKKKYNYLILLISFIVPFSSFTQDTNYLKETSKAFSNVAKKAIPAVVFIKAEYVSKENELAQENPFEMFQDDFFKKFFQNPFNNQGPKMAAGSGCIVSNDGYILTNNHIVKDSNTLTVILNNGEEYPAKIVGTDPNTDLAVIKIEVKDLDFLEFASSDDVEIGEWAIAIGAPFQLQATLTVGVVSAKGRQNLKITNFEDFIQTDAAINPGNSGGPLLNLDAKIIGINTALITQSGGYMGIGFAIPSNMAQTIMKEIIDNGSMNRGHLGISLQVVDKEIAEALDLDSTKAVLISEVIKDSAADKAGLKQGDVIIEYNNKKISTLATFRNEISMMAPDKVVKLVILRDGKKMTFNVKLEKLNEPSILATTAIDLGLEVGEIKDIDPQLLRKHQFSDNLQGVVITTIKFNSIAQRVGLKPGMVIQQINNNAIRNISDFNDALNKIDKKKSILMLIKYQNTQRYFTIKLK
ncbi:MAG: hypothetical protein A3F40_04235 [Chlamydiae bacterium RIFCSPHIGHO2_12_FULL_27_8]|nr:MAG: hypothetical protein A3F40_04235 [Chlamydiae bacterium RIFCSPHIGHO2_12_FULL_27_8]